MYSTSDRFTGVEDAMPARHAGVHGNVACDGLVDQLLADATLEVEKQVEEMRMEGKRWMDKLDFSFRMELLKVPKAVRSMSVHDFVHKYGADLDVALAATKGASQGSKGRSTKRKGTRVRKKKQATKTKTKKKKSKTKKDSAANPNQENVATY